MDEARSAREYKNEIGILRKWEVKEWITKLYLSGVFKKQEFDKKIKILESEHFEDLNVSKKYKKDLGMIEAQNIVSIKANEN